LEPLRDLGVGHKPTGVDLRLRRSVSSAVRSLIRFEIEDRLCFGVSRATPSSQTSVARVGAVRTQFDVRLDQRILADGAETAFDLIVTVIPVQARCAANMPTVPDLSPTNRGRYPRIALYNTQAEFAPPPIFTDTTQAPVASRQLTRPTKRRSTRKR